MPHRPADDPLRLFVATYPPLGVAREMLATLNALDLPAHRATPAEQVHLTLQFVGDTDPRQLARVAESVERSCAGLPAFDLRCEAISPFPVRGPARLIAANADAPPTLFELQRRLAHRLARHPGARRDEVFVPHLTLCRFAGGWADRDRVPWPIPAGPWTFPVEHVALMESHLSPRGATHREVHRVRLGAG